MQQVLLLTLLWTGVHALGKMTPKMSAPATCQSARRCNTCSSSDLDSPLPVMLSSECLSESSSPSSAFSSSDSSSDYNYFPEYLTKRSLRSSSAYIVYPNGDEYKGPINRHGKQQGSVGEYWFSNGRHYLGSFDKGIMHGEGIMTFNDDDTYFWSGGMKNANPHGQGTWHFSNGDYNQVKCFDGKAHGVGFWHFHGTEKKHEKVKTCWEHGYQVPCSGDKKRSTAKVNRDHSNPRAGFKPRLNRLNWENDTSAKKAAQQNVSKTSIGSIVLFVVGLISCFSSVLMQKRMHCSVEKDFKSLLKWDWQPPTNPKSKNRNGSRKKQKKKTEVNDTIKSTPAASALGLTAASAKFAPTFSVDKKRASAPATKKSLASLPCCSCCGGDNGGHLSACGCHTAWYCDELCRQKHWTDGHKDECHKSQSPKSIAEPGVFDAPREMCCPIHLDIMEDPVLAADGETYERTEIENWINTKQKDIYEAKQQLLHDKDNEHATMIVNAGISSPMGFGTLTHLTLIPNRAVARLVNEWKTNVQSQPRISSRSDANGTMPGHS